MKKAIMNAAALALLLSGEVAMAQTATRPPTAQSQTARTARWRYFGVDRAYQRREDAMRDADNYMRRIGWSDQCRAQMLPVLQRPGRRVRINNGERYDTMRTGPTGIWRNVLVDFAGVQSVEGERWEIHCEGRDYVLVLPDVCNNWLSKVTERETVCVIINVEIKNPDEDMLAWQRRHLATDDCWAVRRVDRLFQSGSSGPAWNPIQAGCIGRPCSFDAYNRTYGYRQASQGTIPIDRPGIYQIQVAPSEDVDLCLKLFDPTRPNDLGAVTSSFTNGVRWEQDYSLIAGEHHARVYYESKDMEADGHRVSGPKGLAFWASTAEAERQFQRSYQLSYRQ